jgi:hypothetical protein
MIKKIVQKSQIFLAPWRLGGENKVSKYPTGILFMINTALQYKILLCLLHNLHF